MTAKVKKWVKKWKFRISYTLTAWKLQLTGVLCTLLETWLQLCNTKNCSKMQPWFFKIFFCNISQETSILPISPQGCILDLPLPYNFLFVWGPSITPWRIINRFRGTLYERIFKRARSWLFMSLFSFTPLDPLENILLYTFRKLVF